MVSPFEIAIKKLVEVGFYDILLFVLSLAIFYAILRKSKILGESPLINAVISFVAAFLVFGYPVLIGFSLTMPLTMFFTQSFVWILIFVIGFVLASMFYPDMPKMLAEQFTKRTTLYVMLALGITIILMSTLISVFWTYPPAAPGAPTPSTDVIILAAGVIIFIVLIIIAAATVRGE